MWDTQHVSVEPVLHHHFHRRLKWRRQVISHVYYQQQKLQESRNNKNFHLMTLYSVHNAHNMCKYITGNCEHIQGVTEEDGGS